MYSTPSLIRSTRLLLTISLLFFVTLHAPAFSPPPGETFVRDGVTYYEDEIYQFNFTIPFSDLVSLYNGSNIQNNEIAGFCFIPIRQEVVVSPTEVHFATIGFRVVLTLWDQVSGTVPSIKFNTFNDMKDAFAASLSNPQGSLRYLEYVFPANGPNRTPFDSLDPLIFNTREFDLVFLDFKTCLHFAREKSFYENNNRGNTDGLIVERSLQRINYLDENGIFQTKVLRSLIFRPNPVPPLQNYDSQAAIAYSYGEHCPPYWKKQQQVVASTTPEEFSSIPDSIPSVEFIPDSITIANIVESLQQFVSNSATVRSVREIPPAVIWNKLWFQILMIVLSILGVVFGTQKLFSVPG
ncbi:MAG TPA: hypothetical protein PKA00_08195 [Saprospiraceae bacterium]|nr:hypothetical protein [Saprospiraceae bacterium]HMQ82874.1 hypothetical protein [Saprospiraceae bacterium]